MNTFRISFSPKWPILFFSLGLIQPVLSAPAEVDEQELIETVFAQTQDYLREFQHPDTGVLYGARLSTRENWTSPEDVLLEKPQPWGYGSRISDTVLHTGHMLVALLDAWDARPHPFLEEQIRRHFDALRMMGSLPETHPKAGKPSLTGLVPRGPHPDELAAYFDDSSMDQHTTYIVSLAVYANSALASEDDKKWIRDSLGKVGRRLEKHDWRILRADGVTEAHVGFSWKGFNSNHASILLPSVLALYQGTGDSHWLELYEHFMTESEGRRWEAVHPGPQIRINGHPIYANQNAFRVNAWYRFEEDAGRRKVIAGLLAQSTKMQMTRDFPGEFYRKYHDEMIWSDLQKSFNWGDSELRGAAMAWEKFRPGMLDSENRGLAALAHVRFPLGGFHMVLLSEDKTLIQAHLASVWNMLRTVELEKVDAGETHYLFTVVGLHLYALYFSAPELFSSSEDVGGDVFGPELSIVHNAGAGPIQDVVIEGGHAYAIGDKALRVFDVRQADRPVLLGKLGGLGSVRQIVVGDGVAYVTSRQDGLFVVDVSEPSQPELLCHYDTVEFATGIALSGETLFVACRQYGVELIDISDPSHPRHVSLVRTGEAQSVVVRDGYLYTGVWASSEVVTADVRDPWNPEIVSRVPLDGYGDGVDVEGDFLYAVTGHHSKEKPNKNPGDPGFGKGHGLEVFDLSDPANPVFISRVKFPALYEIGNDTWRVKVFDGIAYVADTYNGLFVVDVSKPDELTLLGHTPAPPAQSKTGPGYIGGLAVVDDFIMLAGGFSDLHVVAAPGLAKAPVEETDQAPVLGDRPALAEETGLRIYRPDGQVYGVDFLSDDRVVVACGAAGVHVVQLWPEIELISRTQTKGFATDVCVSGDRVFVAEGAGGLGVYQVSSGGENLELFGRAEGKGLVVRQVEAPGDGRYVLTQVGANQFYIFDVIDPGQPKQVFKDARHGLLYGDQMMRGLIDDRYTCVFWHVDGLHWYDLKAEGGPAFSGERYPERTGSANGLIAVGDQTLATIRGGYRLLDRESLLPAEELSKHQIGTVRSHLGVPYLSGNRLYSANRSSGVITVADVTDLENPKLIDQIQTAGNPCRVTVRNGSLVIPDGNHGLVVMDEIP